MSEQMDNKLGDCDDVSTEEKGDENSGCMVWLSDRPKFNDTVTEEPFVSFDACIEVPTWVELRAVHMKIANVLKRF